MSEKVKKPLWKKWWFWVLVVLIVGGAGISAGGGASSGSAPVRQAQTESGQAAADSAEPEIPEEPETVYTACTADELMDALDANALKAKSTYQDQYLELTGVLNVIDSDGKYISLRPAGNEYAIIGVQCYLQTGAQKEQVMELSIGDSVTVRGQVTDAGEILGYSLQVDEIIQ